MLHLNTFENVISDIQDNYKKSQSYIKLKVSKVTIHNNITTVNIKTASAVGTKLAN